jgi:hypothetical protein
MPRSDGAFALMTVQLSKGSSSVADAAKKLGVDTSAIDPTFGVVPIDPERGAYAVQVRSDAIGEASDEAAFRGPWSNPAIAPFGPVKPQGS